ncbi:hypothetical protein ABET41_00020 [Metabacillus fastidiosus]|uniref:Uncharacterized protein n=1 Tax=Metabacillus fastidiosus TaxID=1458 RepID=A0ABU6NUP8_9BACI|nr:hypothetical protein [Metabacillus fastidiosus]
MAVKERKPVKPSVRVLAIDLWAVVVFTYSQSLQVMTRKKLIIK